jgi:hypothetical protein
MKKIIRIFLFVLLLFIIFSSVLSITTNENVESKNYAARVPLPIPPPPADVK